MDDAFEHFGGAIAVPDAFGINDCDRAVLANAEAVSFGPVDERLWADEIEFFEPAFEEFPGLEPLRFGTALGLGLIGAEKDMALIFGEAELGGNFADRRSSLGHFAPWSIQALTTPIWSLVRGGILALLLGGGM